MAATTNYSVQPTADPARVAGAILTGTRARVWLPDMAATAALLTFLYVLFLWPGPTRLFHDADAGWHIRSGEQILRTHELPTRDPYSFSRTGETWMNWEWLADVASGAAHRAAGLGGVALLYAAAIAVAVWAWFQLQWRLETNFLLACALGIPLLGTINLHWLARPHIYSWMLMLAALWWAESKRSGKMLAAFAAGTALWANLHGSFLSAPALALVYAAARFLRPLVWALDRDEEWNAARYYLFAAVLAASASLVNPYGWRLHEHVLGYLGNGELLAQVGEFQSFNFHGAGAGEILLALGIAGVGVVLALMRQRLDHFLLGVVLLALALLSARGLPLVALLLLPIAGAHLSWVWKSASESIALQPRLRRALDSGRRYGMELRRLDRTAASSLMLVPALLIAAALSLGPVSAGAGFPASEFPVAAAGRLQQLAPELFQGNGRLLAPDKFGGYLIYRLDGGIKVFFDGRSDFYGADFLRDYRRLVQVRPGWEDLLRRGGFTHALLPNDYSLVDALQRAGWTILYRDGTATLLKRGPAGN